MVSVTHKQRGQERDVKTSCHPAYVQTGPLLVRRLTRPSPVYAKESQGKPKSRRRARRVSYALVSTLSSSSLPRSRPSGGLSAQHPSYRSGARDPVCGQLATEQVGEALGKTFAGGDQAGVWGFGSGIRAFFFRGVGVLWYSLGP